MALEAVLLERAGAGKDGLDRLGRTIRQVKRGKAPASEGLAVETAAAVDRFRAALERAAAVRGDYLAAFAVADAQVAEEVQRLVGRERFREALLWQNRDGLKNCFDTLGHHGSGQRSSRERKNELKVAFYLQRYCMKNDTIGFFGPVGWARLVDGDSTMVVRPGADLIDRRQVFFEGWCIDAIADSLAADPAMRPWLAPLRVPLFQIEEHALRAPTGEAIPLPPIVLALFAAADGERPARDLGREVLAAPKLGLASEAAVYQVLEGMRARGFITWRFQIPLELEPERTLRRQIERIEDEALRTAALAVLDEFECARDAVARAAGDVLALDRALGELAACFTRRTHLAATRASGQIYAGRTLVYEDCRRDIQVELGSRFVAELGPPLSLLLQSARWFTHRLAEHHRELLDGIHTEMTRGTGSTTVDLLSYYRRAVPSLWDPQVRQQLPRELQERWERALAIPAGERRVRYRTSELRPRVTQAFAAPGPGWRKACYHSPDLLIAASSPEAIARGEYEIVLGELHPAVNTLNQAVFMAQHESPERILADIERDLPVPSINPQAPKLWSPAVAPPGFEIPGFTARTDVGLASAKDFHLQLAPDPLSVPRSQVLPLSELVVISHGGRLWVEPRDGRCRFDIVEFFQIILTILTVDAFAILSPRPYTPRITIDRLVLVRETWRLPAGRLEFAQASTPAERFAATRRWSRELDLPRFLFIKMPDERKPFYLDLESPFSVEIFTRAVRLGGEKTAGHALITISEMLPEPDRLWLPDAQGNRYTSELRVVAVDRT